jgi:hypothetical protein
MCWLPYQQSHRFIRESHFQEVAISMNRHAMLVRVAGFQLNRVAADPTGMGVLELGLLHLAPSSRRANCNLNGQRGRS